MAAPVTSRGRDEGAPAGIVRKRGFDFGFDPGACAACGGRCCRGAPGRVWVDAAEIQEISRFLGTSAVDLIQTALQRIDNRLSIRERYDGAGFRCIFLECGAETRCAIYPVRPRQCQRYPFWDRYRRPAPPPAMACPGVVPLNPGGPTSMRAAGD
jgi:hypothetical protein